eukprot:Amastigsp_a679081_15.p3 type:complete len:148 gc:universal Amastigsp_a679081_15:298-741(+)
MTISFGATHSRAATTAATSATVRSSANSSCLRASPPSAVARTTEHVTRIRGSRPRVRSPWIRVDSAVISYSPTVRPSSSVLPCHRSMSASADGSSQSSNSFCLSARTVALAVVRTTTVPWAMVTTTTANWGSASASESSLGPPSNIP